MLWEIEFHVHSKVFTVFLCGIIILGTKDTLRQGSLLAYILLKGDRV